MSEDISSTIRVGVTVSLVAALVATVLNLMVISQGILNNSQANLQSGINQVSQQEWRPYDQTNVSGTIVKSSLNLWENRDVAIIVKTKNATGSAAMGYNYGALIEGATKITGNPSAGLQDTYGVPTGKLVRNAGESFWTANLDVSTGVLMYNHNTMNATAKGQDDFILDSASFRSELIKDSTGVTVGIYFTQR